MSPSNALHAQSPSQAQATAEIIALTAEMTRAWNDGDAQAYGALFLPDSDYVAFDGTWLRGRRANVDHHADLFRTVLRQSRLVFEGSPEIRFISVDVAVMHAMGSVLMPWQDQVLPKRRSLQTYVVRRTSEGWRFEAFHNSRYRPMKLPRGWPLEMILFAMRLRARLAR